MINLIKSLFTHWEEWRQPDVDGFHFYFPRMVRVKRDTKGRFKK